MLGIMSLGGNYRNKKRFEDRLEGGEMRNLFICIKGGVYWLKSKENLKWFSWVGFGSYELKLYEEIMEKRFLREIKGVIVESVEFEMGEIDSKR